jgi:two-component system OmpR family sensor kinase
VRDEFVSAAAHELRTPLAALTLQCSALRRYAASGSISPEWLEQRADRIGRQTARLTRLVDALLDVSRIAEGRLPIELERVDFVAVVRECAERLHEDARRAGSRMSVDAPASLEGVCDSMRLDQIVTNLLTNAIKYGASAPIEVRVEPKGDRVILSVRDHGIGVAEADRARIFQRFERASDGRHYPGIGLGLWIVREIVAALGGRIDVEPTAGGGSTFVVELPLEAPRSAEPD